MKPVEEAFSAGGFRRVVMPGIVLAIGLHPIIDRWLPAIRFTYGVNAPVLLVAEVIFFGLFASSGVNWIYYLYEGYRLPWVTALAGRINQRKVSRLQRQRRQIQAGRPYDDLSVKEKQRVGRIYEYLCDFPLRESLEGGMERYAKRPTRLANVIATYEEYAESRYAVDGVEYWYHLLNLAPDGVRHQFDDKYAFAENLVLTSFAGAVVSAIHTSILMGFITGRYVSSVVMFQFDWSTSAMLSGFGLLIAYLFYRAALPAHREAGAMLRAIVDASIPKFLEWIENLDVPISALRKNKVDAATEYLKALNE